VYNDKYSVEPHRTGRPTATLTANLARNSIAITKYRQLHCVNIIETKIKIKIIDRLLTHHTYKSRSKLKHDRKHVTQNTAYTMHEYNV